MTNELTLEDLVRISGLTLRTLLRRCPGRRRTERVLPSLPRRRERGRKARSRPMDGHVQDIDLSGMDPGSFLAEALPDEAEETDWAPAAILSARAPRDLPRALRPREKLLPRGAGWLSHGGTRRPGDRERNRKDSATRISERLLRRHGLQGLAGLRAEEWAAERGLGRAGAARMCAAFGLGRRAHGKRHGDERPRITKPREVASRVREVARARKERLVGLYLDAQNGLLHQETLSVGSLNTTRTHPREILFPAVVHLALGFILVHNHPSGSLEPSPEEVEFTRSVQRAGELMGIELYDHVIVSRDGYASFGSSACSERPASATLW